MTARAAMIGIDLVTGECNWDVFSGEDYDNPGLEAEAFMLAIKDDFPEREHRVICNDEAQKLLGAWRLKQMGITDA